MRWRQEEDKEEKRKAVINATLLKLLSEKGFSNSLCHINGIYGIDEVFIRGLVDLEECPFIPSKKSLASCQTISDLDHLGIEHDPRCKDIADYLKTDVNQLFPVPLYDHLHLSGIEMIPLSNLSREDNIRATFALACPFTLK